MIALIPARAGSKRVPGKNTRLFFGHPLLAYTIAAAQESGVFSEILVCTDDVSIRAWAAMYGVKAHVAGPPCHTDTCEDILWVADALNGRRDPSFAILRPTSPFRSADDIQRAFLQFEAEGRLIDSLRAVRPVREHPGKMWSLVSGQITPLLPIEHAWGTPWHSSPTQSLPPYYLQTSSLEMAWSRVVHEHHTISGTRLAGFLHADPGGFALDTEADWATAERWLVVGHATLPRVRVATQDPATPTQ